MTNRRELLRLLAGSAPAAAGIGLWPSTLLAQARQAGLIAANVCRLAPETTEGPFYLDPHLMRSDIREDRGGVPMTMRIQIVTADCRAIKRARVDLWHCDAQGNYSGFANQGSDARLGTRGQTFLRGTQISGDDGQVAFRTIFPGWYRGRTTHMHLKVILGRDEVLTGQIFFPDSLSQYVFENAAAYDRSAVQDTTNADDWIAVEAGEGAYAGVTERSDGYDAALVVAVDHGGLRGATAPSRRGTVHSGAASALAASPEPRELAALRA
ncbi:intradiol ring-cleavage dioxygenase [Paracoccus sp. M683]|uniref:intradiol ring-cleavage dioxygenase n=1 Tax=Paracoccus sp. M683 TaxID=2594268 RepID=UPI0011811EA0|nr:intradiol ring-cleavage dioxygenase [Paracoccus sp. M683]TRW96708.1 intradiol ring-cleavage dioxygenase [Paracoccus sp. M683]